MTKNASLLGLCAFMALVSTGFAGPSGDYPFNFGLPGKPVWDITGNYVLSPSVGGSTTVEIPVTITQDSQGMLTGSLYSAVKINGTAATTGTCTLKGKVTNSGGVARINATIKLSGSGLIQGLQTTYSLSASYKLEINPSGTVVGSATGSAKATGIGSGPVTDDIAAALPTTEASWTLQMHLEPAGNKLGGTSSVSLASGRTLNLGVKGTYSSKNGNSVISLSGSDASSKGTTLKVMGTGDALTGLTVKGKILGQVVQ